MRCHLTQKSVLYKMHYYSNFFIYFNKIVFTVYHACMGKVGSKNYDHCRKHELILKLSGLDNFPQKNIETIVYVHPMVIQDYN